MNHSGVLKRTSSSVMGMYSAHVINLIIKYEEVLIADLSWSFY